MHAQAAPPLVGFSPTSDDGRDGPRNTPTI